MAPRYVGSVRVLSRRGKFVARRMAALALALAVLALAPFLPRVYSLPRRPRTRRNHRVDIGAMFFAGWTSLLRILLVGVPAYLLVILFLHFAGKHSLAKTNAYGLVITVALGSALASAVITREVSLADGAVAIALLLALQYLLSTLASSSRWAERVLTQRPTLLLRDGKILHDALRRERVTEAEVRAAVRKQGLDSLERAGAVVLETDGSFTVIPTVGPNPSALEDVEGM